MDSSEIATQQPQHIEITAAQRLAEWHLQNAREDIGFKELTIDEQGKRITEQDALIKQLRQQKLGLEQEKSSLEASLQEASNGQGDKLQAEQTKFETALARQKQQFEAELKAHNALKNVEQKQQHDISKQNEQLASLGNALADRQAILELYLSGEIQGMHDKAQWIRNLEQEIIDLREACKGYEQAKKDQQEMFQRELAAAHAQAANFGPPNTIRKMQMTHQQNGSSSDVSENGLARYESQTSQPQDKIQSKGELLCNVFDSSGSDDEGDDNGDEEDDGDNTQTNIPATAEIQKQAESKGKGKEKSFEEMSEAEKIKKLYEFQTSLDNWKQSSGEKDRCIAENKRIIQDQTQEIIDKKQEIKDKNAKYDKQEQTHAEERRRKRQEIAEERENHEKEIGRLNGQCSQEETHASQARAARGRAEAELNSTKELLKKANEELESTKENLEKAEMKLNTTNDELGRYKKAESHKQEEDEKMEQNQKVPGSFGEVESEQQTGLSAAVHVQQRVSLITSTSTL